MSVWSAMHARYLLRHQFEHWRGKPGRCPECGGRTDETLPRVPTGAGVTIHLPGCTRAEQDQ